MPSTSSGWPSAVADHAVQHAVQLCRVWGSLVERHRIDIRSRFSAYASTLRTICSVV